MDTAGKLAGVVVFVAGVVLLGYVFKATLDTLGAAEEAVRSGALVLAPLRGGVTPVVSPTPSPPVQVARAEREEPRVRSATGRATASESENTKDKPLSPLTKFALVLGARMVGLCALGFLAGLIATQGAHMAGAFRSSARREFAP